MGSGRSNLFDEPVDLALSPLLPVARVLAHLFAHVIDFVIQLAAQHTVAVAGATVGEDACAGVKFLNAVVDEAEDDSELALGRVSVGSFGRWNWRHVDIRVLDGEEFHVRCAWEATA